jgi:translation elongation factor EF-1alpha
MASSNRTVTLFGPVQAGKSTLAGIVLYRQDPAAAEREISRARVQLGANFRPHDVLAYLVDKSEDERKRLPDRGLEGVSSDTTSKRLHFVRGPFDGMNGGGGDIVVIDTPGGWKMAKNQRMRGIFYADIAVYVFAAGEADKVVGEAADTRPVQVMERFGALFTWGAIRPEAPLIIAVSQMDRCRFPEAQFEAARAAVAQYLGEAHHAVFVPISIDVAGRAAVNVFEDDPTFDWFEGPTLSQAIADARDEAERSVEAASTFMIVTRAIHRKGLGVGYFGKVLSGRFQQGARARLLPLRSDRGEESHHAGHIRALEASGSGERQQELGEGELGGVFFSGGHHVGDARNTTIIVDEQTPVAIGSFLRIRLKAAHETPPWVHFRSQIDILWMGRFHPARIFEIDREGDCLVIGAMLLSADRLACPMSRRGDTLVFDEVVLSPPNDKSSYRSARLVSVGTVHGVRLKVIEVGDLLEDPRSLWSLLDRPDEVLPISDASLDPAIVSLIERVPESLAPGAPTRGFTIFDSGRDHRPDVGGDADDDHGNDPTGEDQ